MKISAVISSDIIKSKRNPEDKTKYISFLAVALGLIIGAIFYIVSIDSLSAEISYYFARFSADFTSESKVEVFSGVLLSHIPYIFLMIVFGTCYSGYMFSLVLSFVKAAGLSVLIAYLYSSFGLKGVEYSLLVLLPGKFVLIFGMLLMMNACANNSSYIKKLAKGESSEENSSTVFALKTVTAVLLFILSSLIDCFFAVSFSSLFAF